MPFLHGQTSNKAYEGPLITILHSFGMKSMVPNVRTHHAVAKARFIDSLLRREHVTYMHRRAQSPPNPSDGCGVGACVRDFGWSKPPAGGANGGIYHNLLPDMLAEFNASNPRRCKLSELPYCACANKPTVYHTFPPPPTTCSPSAYAGYAW